ncbi:MAG: carboxypeptidase-like regulatory domain-containing protein [Planctomycetaceae bacterium]|jgi:hypothetical protein|nr:carboxypeptidase-like regulatory domain-containing protein [Planctomycetaceae bacterium]
MTRTIACVPIFLLGLFFLGCAGGTSSIKTDSVVGTITDVNGSPLAGASVNFSPVTQSVGNPAYAITDQNGKYQLQTLLGKPDAGTTPGEYIVTISKSEMIPTGQKEKNSDGKMVDVLVPKSLIPDAYSSAEKSPFKVTVVSGKNQFNFQLKADGT